MTRESIGTPLFGAKLTFTLPDNSTFDFPALWAPTGSVIPQFSAEDFDAVGERLNTLGTGSSLTARIVLDDDPAVSADIYLEAQRGFVPVGDALAEWVRVTYPDDCAYLDEVCYPATMCWTKQDGSVLRMPAHWLNTGAIRLRPPEQLLDEVMKLRHAVTPAVGCVGTIILDAEPTITAAVQVNEDYDLVGLSEAFKQWMQAKN